MSKVLSFRKILLFFGDIILAYISLFLMVLLGFWGKFSWEIILQHLLPFSILYFFWLIIFYIFGLYETNLIKTKLTFYPRLFGAVSVGFLTGIIFFYLIPLFGITPKTNLILNTLIFGVLVFGWRKLFYSLFSSYLLTKIAIIGKESESINLAKEIISRPYLGYKLTALFKIDQFHKKNLEHSFSSQKTEISKYLSSNKVKILSIKEDFPDQIQKEKIDTLIVTANLQSNPWLAEKLYHGLNSKINFIDSAQAYEIITEKIPISSVNQIWFLENLKEGEKKFYDNIKRRIDVVLAILFLLISSPLWVIIPVCIKLEDRGPIFYCQKRIGKNKKPFLLIKFRSMKIDAEKFGAVWAKQNDPRVTKIGKILRRTHLDEIPQMLNILKGELSFVGPRPERPEFVKQLEKEIPYYHIRHLIKPGFTGWAQLKFRYGRTIMDSKEKFQYDLYYLKNRSLFLDLGILLKTAQLLFRGE